MKLKFNLRFIKMYMNIVLEFNEFCIVVFLIMINFWLVMFVFIFELFFLNKFFCKNLFRKFV